MNWFKVYTEARNDAKLRSLSDAQHRVWFNLLCFAAEQPVRGTITSPLTVLAIEVASGDRALVIDTLTALQFLNCVTVSPCNALVTPCNATLPVTGVTEALQPVTVVFRTFEKRQHIKPSDEKERIRQRVAKHRKLKSCANSSTPDVTGNAPVTPCNAPLARDSDTDTEKTPPTPSEGVGPPVSLSVEDLDDEPFAAPGTLAPEPEKPPVENDPDEIRRVAAKAERLFPGRDFGILVHQHSGDVMMADMEYALDETHKARKTQWSYLAGILRRMKNEKPSRGSASSNGQPPRPPAPDDYVTAPADSPWRRKAKKP